MAEFEWTQSGKELLSIFEAKINYYGGAENLCDIICNENNTHVIQELSVSKYTPHQSAKRAQTGYIVKMWHKLSTPTIANNLGISHDTVTKTANLLNLGRNKANELMSEGQRNKVTKWILNTETGIYYENLMLAAKSRNLRWHNLQWFLVKKKKGKNPTPFIIT